jgi:phenylalanine-4-hydroxylase
MFSLPANLRKYIVDQRYDLYTPVDQACWRYILRQLQDFLTKNAHESYLEGLKQTGITVEEIPRIDEISKCLEKFGWRALPVSGFIPPTAFMELQSMGVLPIASDIRSLEHLLYTPAPDIVHEAAGHAPFIANFEFANYLKQYALVAKKAIISSEDLALYEAIRILSDIKENPRSTQEEIAKAQKNLDETSKSVTFLSEAGALTRYAWWTSEYGLIGDTKNPKIFGAGLLSSVGEARSCLNSSVKKIPLTAACVEQTYDITEPQPQLFVTPNFPYMETVLEEIASKMAFRVGGIEGLVKAIQAKTVNTVELNSGLQISGKFVDFKKNSANEVIFIKATGATQLSHSDIELSGHSKEYHADGFSTPLGRLEGFNKCISDFSSVDFATCEIFESQTTVLRFSSGIVVRGYLEKIHSRNGKNILLSFKNCKVELNTEILFDPSWGNFDMATGSMITSVFAGAADSFHYGALEDFVIKKVEPLPRSQQELKLFSLYDQLRGLRTRKNSDSVLSEDLETQLTSIYTQLEKEHPDDWLLLLELYELLIQNKLSPDLQKEVLASLNRNRLKSKNIMSLIDDGLRLKDI